MIQIDNSNHQSQYFTLKLKNNYTGATGYTYKVIILNSIKNKYKTIFLDDLAPLSLSEPYDYNLFVIQPCNANEEIIGTEKVYLNDFIGTNYYYFYFDEILVGHGFIKIYDNVDHYQFNTYNYSNNYISYNGISGTTYSGTTSGTSGSSGTAGTAATPGTSGTSGTSGSSGCSFTWVQNTGTTNVSKIRISNDGQYIVVLADDHLDISSDYGVNWTSVLTGSSITNFDMSESGKYILASSSIYKFISSNYGNSFTSQDVGVVINELCISKDGQYALMLLQNDYIMYSVDYGANFILNGDFDNTVGISCWIDDSNNFLVTGYYISDPTTILLFYSNDYGNTWSVNGDSTFSENIYLLDGTWLNDYQDIYKISLGGSKLEYIATAPVEQDIKLYSSNSSNVYFIDPSLNVLKCETGSTSDAFPIGYSSTISDNSVLVDPIAIRVSTDNNYILASDYSGNLFRYNCVSTSGTSGSSGTSGTAGTGGEADVIIWLKPDGIITNGNYDLAPVTGWTNTVDNNNAIQNSIALQPNIKLNAINSNNAVYFSGVHRFLSIPNMNIPSGNRDMTIYLVFKQTTSNFTSILSNNMDSYNGFLLGTTPGTDYSKVRIKQGAMPNNGQSTTTGFTPGNWRWLCATIKSGDKVGISTSVDNTFYYTSGVGINSFSGSFSPLHIGMSIPYQDFIIDNLYFNGYIAEIKIYNKIVSAIEHQANITYLTNKFGI